MGTHFAKDGSVCDGIGISEEHTKSWRHAGSTQSTDNTTAGSESRRLPLSEPKVLQLRHTEGQTCLGLGSFSLRVTALEGL